MRVARACVCMLLCPKYSISVKNPLSPAVAPSAECYRLRATNRERSDGRIALLDHSIRFIINHDCDPLQAFPQQTAPSLKGATAPTTKVIVVSWMKNMSATDRERSWRSIRLLAHWSRHGVSCFEPDLRQPARLDQSFTKRVAPGRATKTTHVQDKRGMHTDSNGIPHPLASVIIAHSSWP